MDWTALERSRTLLQRRVARAMKCPDMSFGSECYQLLTWLRAHPVLGTEIERIGEPTKSVVQAISDIDNGLGGPKEIQVHRRLPDDERERVALYLAVLKACADNRKGAPSTEQIRWKYLSQILVGQIDYHQYLPLTILREVALDGLAAYFEERIEIGYGLLETALRYKQRSEYFHRKRLRDLADGTAGGLTGERALARDLYEYVFDRNLEFTIEEDTGGGWPDLVMRTPTGGFGVLDAKYLKEGTLSAFRNALARGFHQVARYCATKNESWGVLAAYLNTEQYPAPELERADGLAFLTINSVRIYFVMIDIFDRPSGSKLEAAAEVRISRGDLMAVPDTFSADPSSPLT